MPEKVLFIKQNALIPIEIGSLYLQRLQKLSIFLLQDKNEAEIKELQDQFNTDTVQEDSWGFQVETVATLIKTLEEKAIADGMVEELDV